MAQSRRSSPRMTEPCACTGSRHRKQWTTRTRLSGPMRYARRSRTTCGFRPCVRCTSWSAAGTTLEAEVGDDGMTRIVAHVVDPVAVAKVKNKVYRGFSIGGRVTQRDAANPKTITGLVLSEISLVDRPANPEAVFDCWKAAAISGGLRCEAHAEHASPAPAGSAREPFN